MPKKSIFLCKSQTKSLKTFKRILVHLYFEIKVVVTLIGKNQIKKIGLHLNLPFLKKI